jgi:Leucine-rich repeat (LRR) protein
LRKLFLPGNKITRISGLEKLHNLETLWLNENEIETLDGIPPLPKLRELNVAMNKIEMIGTGLDGLDNLEDLNMAGNKVGNFKELLNLNRLSSLKIATFFDPHYGDNPI